MNRFFFHCGIAFGGILFLTNAGLFAQTTKGELTSKKSDSTAILSIRESKEDKQFTAILTEAQKAYQEVKDYSCTFVKQERVQGKLLAEQTAQMMIRCQPFSVFLKFTAPATISGQEVCYVAGKNKDQMRVRGTGLKSALGFVSMPLNDPRVMAQSRHSIKEAGIGMLLEQIEKIHTQSKPGKYRLEFSRAAIDGKDCKRCEITQLEWNEDAPHRVVIFFEKDSKFPIRYEAYEKMDPQSKDSGDLIECYCYQDLKLNPGFEESMFSK